MSRKTSKLLAALCVLAVVSAGSKARAQGVFTLTNGFAASGNTASDTWQFRYQANGPSGTNGAIVDPDGNIQDNTFRNGAYTLMTSVTNFGGQTGLNGWANESASLLRQAEIGHGSTPQIIKNVTGVNDTGAASGLTWYSNGVSMYLETSNLEVLSWLAPSNGTVNVNYEFNLEWPGHGSQVTWFVDHGDYTGNLASGTIVDGAVSDTGLQTVTNVDVTAGDRINFICEVAPGTAYNYDYTHVVAQIAYTNNLAVVYDPTVSTNGGLGFDGIHNTATNTWSCRQQQYDNGGLTTATAVFTNRNGIYALLNDNWTAFGERSTQVGWFRISGDYGTLGPGFPAVVQNQTGGTFTWPSISYFVIPQNGILMAPDVATISVVSWLAPSNGVVSITYDFAMLDDDRYKGNDYRNNGTLFFVDHGDYTGNVASGQLDPNTNDSTFLLDSGMQVVSNVTVTAGDYINFVLDPNGHGNDNPNADSTGLWAQIAYILPPPPAFSTSSPPAFVAAGQLQLNLTGAAGSAFRLWSTTNLGLSPVTNTWNLVTNSTFSGAGTATVTDTQATNAAEYYVLTQP